MNKNEQFRTTVIKTLDDNPEKTFNSYANELGINKYTRYDLLQQAVAESGGTIETYRRYLDRPDISIMNSGVPRHPPVQKISKSANQSKKAQESRSVSNEFDIISQIEATIALLRDEINEIITTMEENK